MDWNWWNVDEDNGDILGADEFFDNEDNVYYYMYFAITPEEGCSFADNMTVAVNGETSIIDYGGYSDQGYYWAFTVDFEVEAPASTCVIDTIEITGFTEPVYGATPDFDLEVPANADYTTDNVTWRDILYAMSTTETFEAKWYYMVFDIVPNEGCTFADEVTVTINGDASLVDPDYGGILSDDYKYRVFTIDYYLSAPPCDAPSDLSVTDITSNSATVNWDPSDAENYDLRYYKSLDELENESWQYYDNGNNENAIGTDGGNFWWGVMFPGGTYSSSTTATVLHVQAYDYMSMNGTVTLYNGGDYAPANPVGTTNVTFTESEEFVEFTFDEPVAIDPSNNLWVVFYNESGAPHPAAVCANTGNPNGRWISLDGSVWERHLCCETWGNGRYKHPIRYH